MMEPLEHEILALLKTLPIKSKSFVVALSGGQDSVVLTHVMHTLSRVLKFPLSIAHVYHGPSPQPELQTYRRRAAAFSHELAEALGLPFSSNFSEVAISIIAPAVYQSEAALRDLREKFFQELLAEKGMNNAYICMAHHQQDVLETRILRLMRGTGPKGLAGMHLFSPPKLRPFYGITKKVIAVYAQKKQLHWIEDPSNKDTRLLRNWVRHELLPHFSNKEIYNLGASLERIVETLESKPLDTKST